MCHAGSGTRERRKQDPFWAFSSQVCSWCCWTLRIQCLGACRTHTSRWAQTLLCNCRCDRGSFVSLLNTAQLWGKPGSLWVTRFANISLLQDYCYQVIKGTRQPQKGEQWRWVGLWSSLTAVIVIPKNAPVWKNVLPLSPVPRLPEKKWVFEELQKKFFFSKNISA